MALNLSELKELIELISAKDITEFELEEEGVRLKVKKDVVVAAADGTTNNHPPAALPIPAQLTQVLPPAVKAEPEAGLTVVSSPMVGTFYRAPEPGASPFVNEGDRVKPGQVLCIIEAMKLMNEIEAECAGEVVEIFVENAQPVQYGDKLFSIRASK